MPNDDSEDTTEMRERHAVFASQDVTGGEPRSTKTTRDRQAAWDFITTWSEELFAKQFRFFREEVNVYLVCHYV